MRDTRPKNKPNHEVKRQGKQQSTKNAIAISNGLYKIDALIHRGITHNGGFHVLRNPAPLPKAEGKFARMLNRIFGHKNNPAIDAGY